MASESLKDERDVFHLWNPSRKVEEYWEEQQSVIDRRLILQLKYEPRHRESIDALRTIYSVLIVPILKQDPFEQLADCLEDSSFLLYGSFLEGHDRSFDPEGLAAYFITRNYDPDAFPGTRTFDQVCQWMDAAIRFFPALCALVTRFTRLFISQNPDLLANAPERGRLWYMEWVVANSVVQTIRQLVNDDHTIAEESSPASSDRS